MSLRAQLEGELSQLERRIGDGSASRGQHARAKRLRERLAVPGGVERFEREQAAIEHRRAAASRRQEAALAAQQRAYLDIDERIREAASRAGLELRVVRSNQSDSTYYTFEGTGYDPMRHPYERRPRIRVSDHTLPANRGRVDRREPYEVRVTDSGEEIEGVIAAAVANAKRGFEDPSISSTGGSRIESLAQARAVQGPRPEDSTARRVLPMPSAPRPRIERARPSADEQHELSLPRLPKLPRVK